MLLRRYLRLRTPQLTTRSISIKSAVVEYGAPVALYYFITNEFLVGVVTYLLHYGYFGKEDLIGVLESIGASKFLDLKSIEAKSWSFFDDRFVISARFVANFTAASIFMSLWTPIQLPLCVATYPAIRRGFQRICWIRANK